MKQRTSQIETVSTREGTSYKHVRSARGRLERVVARSYLGNEMGLLVALRICSNKQRNPDCERNHAMLSFHRNHSACLLLLIALSSHLSAAEITLHNFAAPLPKGESPYAGVIRDSTGDLYGTTYSGGAFNAGTVYTVHAGGGETILHNFTGGADGGNPYGGVVTDGRGNLYGTTYYGGAFDFGVVYKLSATGQQTVLYSFTGEADGGYPHAGVILDPQGNLYGTTQTGGNTCNFIPFSCGVVYKVDTAGQETVVFAFDQAIATGNNPGSGVVRDAAGNLYGTAGGGDLEQGVVYKVDPTGHETVLYTFEYPFFNDGTDPNSDLALDASGNLYGTTVYGGGFTNEGSLYKIGPTGGETQLISFSGTNGANPYGGVVFDAMGNLYGATSSGGASGFGVVYKLTSTGAETVLYNFTGAGDGGDPTDTLILDASGNLYGTAEHGGRAGAGVVFKIDPTGRETVLYSFPGASGGSSPQAPVLRDFSGNLYGTTSEGGVNGAGTVYQIDATGKETLLYSFTGGLDGADPQAGVFRDKAGNLYGTAAAGGILSSTCEFCGTQGVVYKIDPAGKETVIYSFTGGNDGYAPHAGLTSDGAGNLYSTTTWGGTGDVGTVFRIDQSGQETIVHNFDSIDGQNPYSGVTLDAAGNFYGTTSLAGLGGVGTAYKLNPSGAVVLQYNFLGGTDGANPYAGVILDSSGNLYGTTIAGGVFESGVVYKLDSGFKETILYTFTGGADGGVPYAGLIRDRAGNLYGTTQLGGAMGKGVVFKIDPSGTETVLYSFSGTDGEAPLAQLIADPSGNLYGTTSLGGEQPGGVIFELKSGADLQ